MRQQNRHRKGRPAYEWGRGRPGRRDAWPPRVPLPEDRHPRAHFTAAAKGLASGLYRLGHGTYRWFKAAPSERCPIAVGLGLYGAGHLAHEAALPALGILPMAGVASTVGYAVAHRRTGDEARASKVAAGVGAAGGWLASAAELGLAAGPSGALSWAYWTAFGAAYVIYLRDDGTRRTITWRKKRTNWHRLAPRLGLEGSHLIAHTDTRLGERLEIDTSGTGKRASSLTGSGGLGEQIAEIEKIPPGRARVTAGHIAGRLVISIRRKDPWAQAIPHPTLDDAPEIELPEVADATKPLVVGQDPETGKPLLFPVYNEDGATRTMVVAITRGGKTTFLNDVMERLTAAPNVAVVGIDASKSKDMRRWEPALTLSACGRDKRGKAVSILYALRRTIDYRAAMNADAVWKPTASRPLIVAIIDEIDALVGGGDQAAAAAADHLRYITSKGGSEAVGAILVGQRGTAQWIGGADIRANVDHFVFLKVARSGELQNAAGELGMELPDMARYGEGKAGVAVIASIDGDYDIGRTFKLSNLSDIARIAESRTATPFEPGLVEHLGDLYTRLVERDPARHAPSPTPQQMTTLDGELEAFIPDELREDLMEQRKRFEERQAETRQWLDEDGPAAMDAIDEVLSQPGMSERMAEAARIRRAQEAEQTVIPDKHRTRMLTLLADGTTNSAIVDELGVSRQSAHRYLARLRYEGVAAPTGQGRSTAWHLTEEYQHLDKNGGGTHGQQET